ncbi:hypothetical protein ScPMuIL_003532 [Solemya velum]
MATLSQTAVAASVLVVLVIVGSSSVEGIRWNCSNSLSCGFGKMCVTQNNEVCRPGMKRCTCRRGCYSNRTFYPLNAVVRTNMVHICFCTEDKLGLPDIFCFHKEAPMGKKAYL